MSNTAGYETPLGPTNEFKIVGLDGLQTAANIGSVPAEIADYVTVREYGDGFNHVTVLDFNALPVQVGNTTGASFGSRKIYALPTGIVDILNSSAYFSIIDWDGQIAAAGSGDYSLGSTATADATLSSTDVNILASAAMLDPFVLGVGRSNAATVLSAPVSNLGGLTSAAEVYLNVIVDDADVGDGEQDTILFTGRVIMAWRKLT